MGWSGETFTRTNGDHTGADLWDQDRLDPLYKYIWASRHDAHDQDLANGINACLKKDGLNAATGNINLGNHKIVDLADGLADTDAVNMGQINGKLSISDLESSPTSGETNKAPTSAWAFAHANNTASLHPIFTTTVAGFAPAAGAINGYYLRDDGTWADGVQGPPGEDGVIGSQWYSGTGVPSAGLGVDGDFYLNDANGDVYSKAAGAWSVVDNLTGPAGADGATGADGADGADGAEGPTAVSTDAGNRSTLGSDSLLFTPSSVTVSDTPPVGPADGDEWWDTKTGAHATWYEDGDSGQWVAGAYETDDPIDVVEAATPGVKIEIVTALPGTPDANTIYFVTG